MAKGYEQNQQRLKDLNRLGKDLVRRSRTRCELCNISGVKLHIFEVPPLPEEPELEKCITICDVCYDQLTPMKHLDMNHWRCLHESAWSEIPAVQVIAIYLLKQLATEQPWATDLLEQLYLSEEVEVWVNDVSLT